ncbi:MAG: hypothetical protein JWN82_132 [Candidatus Saccharibacteria bacterium]|nr:hypothetical protein [Candidatus Saccharibacteria bacterium]
MTRLTKLIHITLSLELLRALDEHAQQEYVNRCEFVRQAIVEKIRSLNGPAAPLKPEQARVDLLMTDQQLADMRQALMIEQRRRHEAKWHRQDKDYQ